MERARHTPDVAGPALIHMLTPASKSGRAARPERDVAIRGLNVDR
jgi:hypothetical protein